jgi:hypothetical protein
LRPAPLHSGIDLAERVQRLAGVYHALLDLGFGAETMPSASVHACVVSDGRAP